MSSGAWRRKVGKKSVVCSPESVGEARRVRGGEVGVARDVVEVKRLVPVCPWCVAAGREFVSARCIAVQGLIRYYECRTAGCGGKYKYFGRLGS